MSDDTSPESSPDVGTRWPELIVSAALMGAGVLVITDSLRIGNGWADDGPQSGYFPFFIGLFLLGASSAVFLTQLWRFKRRNPVFAQRHQLRLVALVLAPLTAYVALISQLGIYVASFSLIAHFMLVHGRYKLWQTAALAAAIPLACYLIFEQWFHVLLPGLPLDALLEPSLELKPNLVRAAALLSLCWLAKDILHGRSR